ncbi:hypothetical protein J7892_00515 [Mycoplasmopsis agalactiae]|nr:hypothetical protein [Mycoplasmopsis agalactiae]
MQNMSLILFIVSVSLTFLSGLAVYILVSLNWYKFNSYRYAFVKSSAIYNKQKVRKSYIDDLLKSFKNIVIYFACCSLLNLFGIITFIYSFIAKINTAITWYQLMCFLAFAIFVYIAISTAIQVGDIKKWKVSNESISQDYLIENTIKKDTEIMQMNLPKNELKLIAFSGRRRISFYIKLSKNFETKSFEDQQEEIYNKLILDFENTKFENGTIININMFKAIFSKYEII